jgi:hypothetical protein
MLASKTFIYVKEAVVADFKAIVSLELQKNIHAYGVVRTIKSQGIASDNATTLNADNLLNNTRLINFEDWLFQLDYAAKNEQKRAKDRLALLKSMLIGDIFPELSDIRFVSDEKLSSYIEFKTKDGWHKFAELGYGYRATLSWMCDFCKKMFDRYPDSEQPLKSRFGKLRGCWTLFRQWLSISAATPKYAWEKKAIAIDVLAPFATKKR